MHGNPQLGHDHVFESLNTGGHRAGFTVCYNSYSLVLFLFQPWSTRHTEEEGPSDWNRL